MFQRGQLLGAVPGAVWRASLRSTRGGAPAHAPVYALHSLLHTAAAARQQQQQPAKLERTTPVVPPGALAIRPSRTVAASASVMTKLNNWFDNLRRPAIDVNFDFGSWKRHKGKLRNMVTVLPHNMWTQDMRRTVFPDVFQVACTAGLITWYNDSVAAKVLKLLDTDGDGDVSMVELKAGIDQGLVEAHHVMGMDFFTTVDMCMLPSVQPFMLTALPLGMILTFKTQSCHARYTEARGLWGALNNESRALSSRILALAGGSKAVQPGSEAQRAVGHAVKCIMTFPRTLKYHITLDGFCPNLNVDPGMSDAEINAVKATALRAELASVWDSDVQAEKAFVDRLLANDVGSRPLHVLQELSEIVSQVLAKPESEGGVGLQSIHVAEIYRSVTRLQDVLGACERIYRTPVYTGYTKFLGRCVWLWTNLLPMALYPIMGPAATLPTSVVVSLFLYGLEDVGSRIEQPFETLPLWQYCDGIDAACKQHLAQHELLRDLRH